MRKVISAFLIKLKKLKIKMTEKEKAEKDAAEKETKTNSKGLKVVRHDSQETIDLQKEGWEAVEIKDVDGVKMHFLKKPEHEKAN